MIDVKSGKRKVQCESSCLKQFFPLNGNSDAKSFVSVIEQNSDVVVGNVFHVITCMSIA